MDQLRRPKHFPEPVLQYTLKEITILWHIYGGHDFTPSSPPSHTPSSGSSLHRPRPNSSSGSLSSFYAPLTNSRAKTNTNGSRPPSSSSTTATGMYILTVTTCMWHTLLHLVKSTYSQWCCGTWRADREEGITKWTKLECGWRCW